MRTMERGNSDLDQMLVEKSRQPVVARGDVKYLLFLEFMDKIAFRGLESVLEILLLENLQLSENVATEIFHFFIISSFLGSIVGSVVSDQYLGKYKSICFFSLLSVFASIVLLIVSSTPHLEGTIFQALAFVALLVFVLGYGGDRPTLTTLGGDEVKHSALIELSDHTEPRGGPTPQQRWFSSMYITSNFAYILSSILFPLIRVHSHGSFFYLMLVPACAKTSGLFVFWLGRNRYLSVVRASKEPGLPDGDHEQHQKDLQTDSAKESTELLVSDSRTVKWDGYTVFSSTFIFLLPTSIFHTLNFQSSSTWVYQARSMDRDVSWLSHWTLAPDQIQALKPTLVTIIAPLLNQIIYPYVDRHIAKVTNLRKCVVSMLLATLAFAMSGGIQLLIDMQNGQRGGAVSDVSIFWQLPQILTLSFAEPMLLIPLYDWTYNQAPESMKATYNGIFLAIAGLGNIVTILCVALLAAYAANALGIFFFTDGIAPRPCALFPWRVFELPNGELAAPTNDINTTVALALLTSVAYFYAGLHKKGLSYFGKYIQPTPVLLPINILEDFTKPLSLSFRLFGNILADELVVAVLISLVPLVVPIPMMFLGLFTSAIQALIFATLAAAYIGESMEGHH